MSVSSNFRKNKTRNHCQACSRSKSATRKQESTLQPKAKKLFTIIESFHNSLCSLPLNLLITNNNPDQWIHEQNSTLQELSLKLKNHRENPQADYYKVKLESVGVVLRNIKENVQMLSRLRETIQYSSNQSSNSSSSRVSVHPQKQQNAKNTFLCHKYEISTDRNEQVSSRVQFPTSLETLKSQQEEVAEDANDVYRRELDKYQKNVDYLRTKRLNTLNENNPNLQNSMKVTENVKSQRMITVDTVHKNASMETSLKKNSFADFQTERANYQREIFTQKAQYEEMFEMMKEQLKDAEDALKEKNQQIEKILVRHQEMSEVIELFKMQKQEDKKIINFSTERIKILEEANLAKSNELKEWRQRQIDLRQTIKVERNRNQELLSATQENEWRVNSHVEEIKEMRETIASLMLQAKKTKKQERVNQQKMQIYKQKYFKLVNAQEIYNNPYTKKNAKLAELHKIIEQHRSQIEQK